MKRAALLILLSLAAFPATRADDPPELSREYLSLLMRHLYRWHLDETMLASVDDSNHVEFLVRRQDTALDEGDRSSYLELYIPQIRYSVLLKKADYKVPEVDGSIRNADYRIIRAELTPDRPADLDRYHRIEVPKQEMLDYLFSVRNQRTYPDQALRERMADALRREYMLAPGETITGPQVFYLAPISDVSNNLWVFWESKKKIIRFSSDADIATKEFWAIEKLGAEVYDLDKNVVVSIAEVPGSNAYVTRDWAARVLYNCIVFGQRIEVMPKTE